MKTIIGFVLLGMMTVPAVAQKTQKQPRDPNRVICRNEEVIGSRLQTKRTCMTAWRWAELEREQRMTVEKVQNYKPRDGN